MRAENVKKYAKYMRENPTLAESKFWDKVSKRKFLGLRFNRQKVFNYVEQDGVMRFYIVDFYCHELKLIIEIDGAYHDNPSQIELDELRTETLKSMGLKLIRLKNDDVLNNWDGVKVFLGVKIKEFDDDKLGVK